GHRRRLHGAGQRGDELARLRNVRARARRARVRRAAAGRGAARPAWRARRLHAPPGRGQPPMTQPALPVPALQIHHLTKAFGGLTALRDVSFSVPDGAIVGLIGPNGAGKSTLFEVVSGNLAPTRGFVQLYGQDITTQPAHVRRRAGLCRTFQKVRLFDNLTVEQNVSVAASRCAPKGGNWRR